MTEREARELLNKVDLPGIFYYIIILKLILKFWNKFNLTLLSEF